MPSSPDRLSTQDDGRSAGKPFAIDQEDLFERRVDAQPLADLGVLPREDDFVDAAQGGLQVGHDLLAAHDQDHSARARDVRPELAARGRRGDEHASFGYGRNASEHEVRRGDQLTDLPALSLAIHREEARPKRVVTPRLHDLLIEADVLERLQLAGVDFRALWNHAQHNLARLLAGVDDDRLDFVRAQSVGHPVYAISERAHSGRTNAATPTATPTTRLATPICMDLALSRERASASTTWLIWPSGPKLNTPRDPKPAQK